MRSAVALSFWENRRHERIPYRGTIHIQCAGDTTWFMVYGRDLSAGGFGFTTNIALQVGEQLLVSMPDAAVAALPATVKRVNGAGRHYDVGIAFDEDLDEALVAQLCAAA